jgi:hypothetical protein
MRKKAFCHLLAIMMFLPFILSANTSGPGKDINGIYKNDKFVLKIENFDQQTSSFSFTLNSTKESGCTISLQGTAVKLRINYPTPDKVRYEYVSSDGCRYFFTVFTMEKTTVDVMRYGCKDNAMNSCLPEQVNSKLTLDNSH